MSKNIKRLSDLSMVLTEPKLTEEAQKRLVTLIEETLNGVKEDLGIAVFNPFKIKTGSSPVIFDEMGKWGFTGENIWDSAPNIMNIKNGVKAKTVKLESCNTKNEVESTLTTQSKFVHLVEIQKVHTVFHVGKPVFDERYGWGFVSRVILEEDVFFPVIATFFNGMHNESYDFLGRSESGAREPKLKLFAPSSKPKPPSTTINLKSLTDKMAEGEELLKYGDQVTLNWE